MVEPPEGGVPGNDSKTIQQCFNARAVLPISKGVLDHAGRNHTFVDAPGGEFLFIKCAPKGSLLKGSNAYLVAVADVAGKVVMRGIKHPAAAPAAHWGLTDFRVAGEVLSVARRTAALANEFKGWHHVAQQPRHETDDEETLASWATSWLSANRAAVLAASRTSGRSSAIRTALASPSPRSGRW